MVFASDISNPCPTALTGPASTMFMTLINTLITSQCLINPENRFAPDYGPHLEDGDEFDFIVVGAGSAGARVASKLSENPNWKILLLEAGGYPSSVTEIPRIWFSHAYTSYDWGYRMEPSSTGCLGIKGERCGCPRGKGLGGSSSINAMLYIRGNRKDFDTWAEMGNTGWDYDSVLKHYKKFEDLQDVNDERFGKGGDLKLTRHISDNPIRKILIDSYNELGYEEYKEEKPIGYLDTYTTIYEGTRFSTAKAFLTKDKKTKNLYIALNAQVGKLLFNEDGISVAGVEVRINNKLLKIKSTKEVILSAGTVNSPQILMNSGIGPEKHLKDIGIPVRKNLKVGENLQDHLIFTGLFMNMAQNILPPKTKENVMDDWYQFFMHRKGSITRAGIQNLLFFFDSKHNSQYPTLEQYYIPIHQNDLYGELGVIQKALNIPDEVIKVQNENNKRSHSVFLIPSIAYPKSVGRIELRSSDPFDAPKIFANYFSDENNEDLQVMLEGIRFYQNVTKTNAFAPYNPELVHLDIPNCRKFTPDSDDYWRCALRNLATTVYHLIGTCKMGPKTDTDAVVDPRLRVYGVKGVRVIDGSIMPKMISCNTNAPIIMIGEKGAEMIQQDWSQTHTEL